MRVRDLLRTKDVHVVRIDRDAALKDALSLMASYDVGSVAVTRNNCHCGMLTFREVVRALHDDPTGFQQRRVRDLMLAENVSATLDMTVEALRELFVQTHARYIPVLDGNAPVAVVSLRDVAEGVLAAARYENALLRRYVRGGDAGRWAS